MENYPSKWHGYCVKIIFVNLITFLKLVFGSLRSSRNANLRLSVWWKVFTKAYNIHLSFSGQSKVSLRSLSSYCMGQTEPKILRLVENRRGLFAIFPKVAVEKESIHCWWYCWMLTWSPGMLGGLNPKMRFPQTWNFNMSGVILGCENPGTS